MNRQKANSEHQQQCQKSPCLHPVSEFLFLCFYWASLWQRQFLWGDHTQEVFALSSFCKWYEIPRRNLQIICRFKGFYFNELFPRFDGLSESIEQFLRKVALFFLRVFSISGSMQLNSRALWVLAAMEVGVIPR